MSSSFLEAQKAIAKSATFKFSKTLEDLRASGVFDDGIAESLRALSLPSSFTGSVATAMQNLPPLVEIGDLAPRVRDATEETVALAEVVLIACLSEGGYTKLAGALLAYVVALMRVYWRLAGKLD